MGILSGLAGLALNEGAKLLKSGFSSTMFVEYASNGDIAKMQNALNNGADINAKDPGGMPALFIAVEKNQLSATKFLLENGAYPDITDKENDTPLMRAMYYNRPEIAKLLIEYGANVNTSYNDDFVLTWATFNNYTDIVRLLIEKGANIECYNPVGCTPLIIASNGNYEICEFLIQNGADVNARRSKTSNKDWTSLMYASYYSKFDIMNLLLENGALIDIRTPSLHSAYLIAAQYGTPDAVELLINNGAELNCTDSDGDSALICAAKNEQTDNIKLLIEYGVDINIRNKDGKRAIDYAKEKRMSVACKMLSNPDNYGYATRKINLNKKSDLSNAEKSNNILDDTSEIDIIEQLSKLKKLREQDLIDDEEYKAKKAELLAKM
ncbi:MAG: ankyrin repeat domain-containing protein [Treponema sp.]|nr:ankyrin repeat domain-containing protein [Treponema sp.]